jgi:ferric-dicitrate binding protein FerR (iron transport regulator)
VVIPTVLIEIVREQLEQDRVDAIAASDGPLSPGDRAALQEGLTRAQEQHEAAENRLRAINARLAGQAPRKTAGRAS